jgi:hypothetical protein
VKAVRLVRACWVNDRVHGDVGNPLVLEDAEAYEVVEVHHLAVYDAAQQTLLDERLGQPREIPVLKRDDPPEPDQVLDLADQGLTPEQAAQELTQLSEELGLYDEPVPAPAAELTMPWTTHPKAKWIEWALRGDHSQPRPSPDEVAGMTKNELMGRYGERL